MIQTPNHSTTQSGNRKQAIEAQLRERDAYILESVRQADPLLRRMASRYGSDYDDLYQIAAEVVTKSYEMAQQTVSPRAYLHRAIRNALLRYVGAKGDGPITGRAQRLEDHYQIFSLDMPLSVDPDQSLYDLVGSDQPYAQGHARDYSRLYAMLSALPTIYREVVCMRFGLCGYSVHRNCEVARALGLSQDQANARLQYAKTLLRQNTELLNLVGCPA